MDPGDFVGQQGGVDPAHAASVCVGPHRRWVTAAKGKAGVCLPVLGEAMHLDEIDGREVLAPVGEHAAPADGWELFGVADAHEPPTTGLDEANEPVEVVGRRHPCLIEDHGGAGRRVLGSGIGQELGERPRRASRLAGEDIGRLTGRREPEHRSAVLV